MTILNIGDRKIGDGQPPFFIAELGTCHCGSIEIAKANTRAAIAAGADCVKTETFYETEVFDDSATKTYSIRGKKYSVPLKEHMRRYQFTLEQHHEIKKLCDELTTPFMATAHDFDVVDFLVDIGVAAIKIASPDIVHYPLIRHVGKSKIPLFLDTGGAYQHEVEQAVKTAREAGCEQLVVNHNPSGHPAPPEKHDLRILGRFKSLFPDAVIGLSDHYDGYEMSWAAVIAGAQCVEKPISEDRFIEECEHIWAVSVNDLPDYINKLRYMWLALGEKERRGEGIRPKSPHRVSLAANKDLSEGDEINLENVTFGKPRNGIGVEHWEIVSGRRLKAPKTKGAFIQWDDI